MKLSEETLRYPASYYCSTLIHTSTTMKLSEETLRYPSACCMFFSINTYLYNMKLSEETPRYPASHYCPTLIHTCTI